MEALSEEVLLDKMHGCFLGKEIGFTLGFPHEIDNRINNVEFYTQNFDGYQKEYNNLDLEIICLIMAEYYGLEHLTSRHFGEYWLNAFLYPWSESANCYWNCSEGFFPPLSGSCENNLTSYCKTTSYRSGIWACLCAGRPDEAIRYAWMESSCDHKDDGIYTEVFTAALGAAAFYCSDLHTLIQIGLTKIPAGRLRETIELTIAGHAAGLAWRTVRNEIMKHNEDIDTFKATAEVPLIVLSLLYGENDFGKTVCLAVNCSDSPSFTAAAAGSILGIIQGAKALPEKWAAPISNNIRTLSLNIYRVPLPTPMTVTELTHRILLLRKMAELRDPQTGFPAEDFFATRAAEKLWQRSEYELQFDLLFITISVNYPDGPYVESGKPIRLKLVIQDMLLQPSMVWMRWLLPENWTSASPEMSFGTDGIDRSELETTVTPPETSLPAMSYLYLEVTTVNRRCPIVITIPVRNKMAVSYQRPTLTPGIDKILQKGHRRAINLIRKQANPK